MFGFHFRKRPSVTLSVAYEVKWHDPWEPFYIAPTEVIKYDERFKQVGKQFVFSLARGGLFLPVDSLTLIFIELYTL